MTNYSVYPSALDGYFSLQVVRDGIDEIVAKHHNSLRSAIIAIEQELGVQPSGTYATVADRLDYIGDTRAVIDAHLVDTTDAHDASAISIVDAVNYYLATNVEDALAEAFTYIEDLLPNINELGQEEGRTVNSGIPNFYNSSGTRFIFNTMAHASDNIQQKTQPSENSATGVKGIHILEVSSNTPNGTGILSIGGVSGVSETLSWQAPGDSGSGDSVDIHSLSAGDVVIVSSSDSSKKLRVVRNNTATLGASGNFEYLEVYSPDFTSGYFSLTDSVGGNRIESTDNAVITSVENGGISRGQFVITGIISPADRGTLVLQRRTNGGSEFIPISALDLSNAFDETKRSTGQPAYIPTMSLYDSITLYDRLPVKQDYSEDGADADGNVVYDDYVSNYDNLQLAKYIIPVSNEDVASAELLSPPDISELSIETYLSAYRLVHFRDGVTDFSGNPSASQIYGVLDTTPDDNDVNSVIKLAYVFLDDSETVPGVETLEITPVSNTPSLDRMVSGISYYNSESDTFDVTFVSDANSFNKVYLLEDVLNFGSDALEFPSGTTDANWGSAVDLLELKDSGGTKYSDSNLPAFTDKAYYTIDAGLSSRRPYVEADVFSNKTWVSAVVNNPFGVGDRSDAYGDSTYTRILVNGYSRFRAEDDTEYFTDEERRIDDSMEFRVYGAGDPAVEADGYNLSAFNGSAALGSGSLQVGGGEGNYFATAGLVYPQYDYYNNRATIRPLQENDSDLDYSSLTGDRIYQRLFSLGYSINNGSLQITSAGEEPIEFYDIYEGNSSRFGKIEIKIPGSGSNSTGWLDIGKLFSTGRYENGDGALFGEVTGSAGDITIPFTFGTRDTSTHPGYTSGYLMNYSVAVRVTYFGDTADERTESKKRIITMIQLLP